MRVKNITIRAGWLSLAIACSACPYLAAADTPAYYYQNRHRVDVVVDTNEIAVKTVDNRTTFVPSTATSLASLNYEAQRLMQKPSTSSVLPVLRAPDTISTTTRAVHLLTNEIAFALPAGKSPAALVAQYKLDNLRPVSFAENTYIASLASTRSDVLASLHAANSIQEQGLATWASPLVLRQQTPRLLPNDPLFVNQWHLNNTGVNTAQGIAGNDLNVIPAWDHSTGLGINIAIGDTGVETTHTDLMANVRTDIDHDFNDDDDDPTPVASEFLSYHGTGCAGVAAGKGNNGTGISGVAPDASIVGLRLISLPTTDEIEADGLSWKTDETSPADQVFVSSNSWGPSDNGRTLEGPGPLTEAALEHGVTTGRNGKGTIYVWAGGNGRQSQDNMNKDGYANNPNVIAVAATNSAGTFSYYSDPGAALLVNAPSSGTSDGIYTTDISGTPGGSTGDYLSNFGGTSSAAPAVAGAVALVLQANPNLTYRDVMHLLVDTAIQNDPASSSWVTNGAGRKFSHDYGFGRVNAGAAVAAAPAWQNVQSLTFDATAEIIPSTPLAIPDASTSGVAVDLPISTFDDFSVEHVELEVDITHTFRGDLSIQLISPSGMISQLCSNNSDSGDNYAHWRFRSVAHWDENPNGAWKVKVADTSAQDVGSINYLRLRIMGYRKTGAAVEMWDLY